MQLQRFEIISEDSSNEMLGSDVTEMKYSDPCVVFLLMEYATEGSLAKYIADISCDRKPVDGKSVFSVRELENITTQIARAVQQVHRAGIVHLDIKH